MPAFCGNTCALAGACLVNALLCIPLIEKVIFAYRRQTWFSLKLRYLRREMKSRWCLVEKLNIAEWSGVLLNSVLNAAWFCSCCLSPLQIFSLFSVL